MIAPPDPTPESRCAVEVYEDAGRRWRFRVKAANGEIVAQGEAYGSRADAMRGYLALAEIVSSDPRIVSA